MVISLSENNENKFSKLRNNALSEKHKLNFIPISLALQKDYENCLDTQLNTASDYIFSNIWAWGDYYGLELAFDFTAKDNITTPFCWLRQTKPQTIYWAPVGKWQDIDWQLIDWTKPSSDSKITFIRIPQTLLEIWQKKLNKPMYIKETPEHWDYIYSVEELSNLRGNKFHRKRNHYNQFLNQYSWTYTALSSKNIPAVLSFQEEWLQNHALQQKTALLAENIAIAKILNNWQKLNSLLGACLYVQDKLIAYTVAEALNSNTLVIHFEKALSSFRGAYQAINAMFLQHNNNYTYVNREQDLGDEGLRKAKKTYNPVDFIRKQEVCISNK